MRLNAGATAALVLLASGCSTGGIGDVLGGVLGGGAPTGSATTVRAEVQEVDARNGRIEIRTEDGQYVDVRYDQNTRVVYQQQEYEVSALERGDLVRMAVDRGSDNQYYTAQIEVEQSVQDREGVFGDNDGVFGGGYDDDDRLYTINGTVDQVDQTRGLFTLRTSGGEVLTVGMPYNASSTTRTRFGQLRRGTSVRIEGRFLTEERVELTRFF